MTDVWQDSYHTFFARVTTGNIVMWVTRLSTVDWVYFKTRILLVTLRTQNQPRVTFNAFSEAEHLSLSVECVGSKRQFPTVLQNLRSFRWMLDCEWMDYLLSIYGCGDGSIVLHEQQRHNESNRDQERSSWLV